MFASAKFRSVGYVLESNTGMSCPIQQIRKHRIHGFIHINFKINIFIFFKIKSGLESNINKNLYTNLMDLYHKQISSNHINRLLKIPK